MTLSLPRDILNTAASWKFKRETQPLLEDFATPDPAAQPAPSSVPSLDDLLPAEWKPAQAVQTAQAAVQAAVGAIPSLESLIPEAWRLQSADNERTTSGQRANNG